MFFFCTIKIKQRKILTILEKNLMILDKTVTKKKREKSEKNRRKKN